jgi:hypothetical protein
MWTYMLGSWSSGWRIRRKSRMYELIRKQIAADYFQQRFPNDGQRFVAWYLRNILFRDMNETRDDITDGGDDKQIDAIVRRNRVPLQLNLPPTSSPRSKSLANSMAREF